MTRHRSHPEQTGLMEIYCMAFACTEQAKKKSPPYESKQSKKENLICFMKHLRLLHLSCIWGSTLNWRFDAFLSLARLQPYTLLPFQHLIFAQFHKNEKKVYSQTVQSKYPSNWKEQRWKHTERVKYSLYGIQLKTEINTNNINFNYYF